jgi:hypothetical protein
MDCQTALQETQHMSIFSHLHNFIAHPIWRPSATDRPAARRAKQEKNHASRSNSCLQFARLGRDQRHPAVRHHRLSQPEITTARTTQEQRIAPMLNLAKRIIGAYIESVGRMPYPVIWIS